MKQLTLNYVKYFSFNMLLDFLLPFIFYMLSSFSCGGLYLLIFSYLNDFYNKSIMTEVENNLFLSFALSQLVGALVKLVLSEWIQFNFCLIGVPMLIIAVSSLFLLKESPKDLLIRNYWSMQESIVLENDKMKEINSRKIMFKDQQHQVSEQLYVSFKEIGEANQRKFYNRTQFQLMLNNFYSQEKQRESISKFEQLVFSLVMMVITFGYFGPLFFTQDFGMGISFNMFLIALSEIVGIIFSMKTINSCNYKNQIKTNFFILAILSMTLTLCQEKINNHQNEELLFTGKTVPLIFFCFLRFILIFTLFLAIKYERSRYENDQMLTTGCILGLWGGFLAVMIVCLNLALSQYFILFGVLFFIGGWIADNL